MESLKYSGERMIPEFLGETNSTRIEHMARYRLAQGMARNQRVLDACCGVGYGSAMIAEVAREVVGFDICEKAIKYARMCYRSDNLRFEVSDVFDWQEGGFGLAVAFECIEHVADGGRFVSSLATSLRSGGRLILSTPLEHMCRESPYHVQCYSLGDLAEILRKSFSGYYMGQRGAIFNTSPEDYWIFVGSRR